MKPRPCPRRGCTNPVSDGQIICHADFVALAGMCRAKSRLGQPVADQIAGDRGLVAYCCPLCRQWHNGGPISRQEQHMIDAQAAVQALRDDPRVGPLGLLQLADAWTPSTNVKRSRWSEGIDQREALTAP